jgi:serine/threonine protein kinase
MLGEAPNIAAPGDDGQSIRRAPLDFVVLQPGSEFIPDLRNTLQRTLAGSYTIERELGGGGMSSVFVAEETALGRRVVSKILPPELGHAVSSERFRQEIRFAARLTHPHIVPLLAAGESEGAARCPHRRARDRAAPTAGATPARRAAL